MKYIVRANATAVTEVEAGTPFDAKMDAMEDENFESQINNPDHTIEVYKKGDEPMQLTLTPSEAERLTGILGEFIAEMNQSDEEVERVYSSIVDYLEGA